MDFFYGMLHLYKTQNDFSKLFKRNRQHVHQYVICLFITVFSYSTCFIIIKYHTICIWILQYLEVGTDSTKTQKTADFVLLSTVLAEKSLFFFLGLYFALPLWITFGILETISDAVIHIFHDTIFPLIHILWIKMWITPFSSRKSCGFTASSSRF